MGAFSKYSSGSTLELTFLAFPLFLSLSFFSLMSFCDRIFLSYYSLDAFKAIGIASYLSLLFQLPIIRLASMNQALIARSLGEENFEKIGPYTWQMIWCSLLTTLVFLPVSYFAGTFYFAHSEVESLSMSYFSIMMMGNCVFPISNSA